METAAQLVGTYAVTTSVTADTCGGAASGAATWTVEAEGGGYRLSTGATSFSGVGTASGNTLTVTGSIPESDATCTATAAFTYTLTFTDTGLHGTVAATLTPPCDGSGRASCTVSALANGIRQ